MIIKSITSKLQEDGSVLSIQALFLIDDLKIAVKNLKEENRRLKQNIYKYKVRMQQLRDSNCDHSE